ncbi:MAG: hypothetical protein WEB78_11020 [Ilumatobacteraceae bacterium]
MAAVVAAVVSAVAALLAGDDESSLPQAATIIVIPQSNASAVRARGTERELMVPPQSPCHGTAMIAVPLGLLHRPDGRL